MSASVSSSSRMIPATTISCATGYVKTELTGKFPTLSTADIAGGALCLPIPSSAQRDKDGKVINGLILQRPYWFRYM